MHRNLPVPTDEDYRSYDGAHTAHKWNERSDAWRCPACKRSKREIMRQTRRRQPTTPGNYEYFYGWMAGLHGHHDHGCPQQKPRVNHGDCCRFEKTVICDQCNSVDGAAKTKLGLPSNFSFSPEEIGGFISATPHGRHVIDFEAALAIFERL